jgi:UDP-N-acetyl-D-mannosaminuronate dehydrogenase
MVNFAAAGVKCIGVDVNPSLVEALSGGETRGFRRFHPDRRLKVDLRV